METYQFRGVRGEYDAVPVLQGDTRPSLATLLAPGPASSSSATKLSALSSPDAERTVGDVASSFFSRNFASSPSTRLSRASSTSVLGPRFLGTASIGIRVSVDHTISLLKRFLAEHAKDLDWYIESEGGPTVYTWALKYLTSLARRSESIALDLVMRLEHQR